MRRFRVVAIVASLLVGACSDGGDDPAPAPPPPTTTTTTTTVVPTTMPAPPPLPIDARLPAASDLGPEFDLLHDDAAPTDCAASASPTTRTGATYISNAAAQAVTVELLTGVANEPMCADVHTTEDGQAWTIVSAGEVVVVVGSRIHFGGATTDGVWTDDLAAAVVRRVEAMPAVRLACRRFYGLELDEPALVERCDTPVVERRDDCYSDTADLCVHLGGYLSVFEGERPDVDAGNVFQVNGRRWTILPESD